MSALDEAISKAKAAAATKPKKQEEPVEVEVELVTEAPKAVAVRSTGQMMSLRDVTKRKARSAVQQFLKVKEFGMVFGQDKTNKFHSEFMIIVRPGMLQPGETIRIGKDPVQFFTTYGDGLTKEGHPWDQAVQSAKRADPKAYVYCSLDVAGELVDDVLDAEGKVFAPKGTIIGFSTPPSNEATMQQFIKENIDKLESTVLIIKVGFEKKVKGSYKWGIFTFEIVGEVDAATVEAQEAEAAAA